MPTISFLQIGRHCFPAFVSLDIHLVRPFRVTILYFLQSFGLCREYRGVVIRAVATKPKASHYSQQRLRG